MPPRDDDGGDEHDEDDLHCGEEYHDEEGKEGDADDWRRESEDYKEEPPVDSESESEEKKQEPDSVFYRQMYIEKTQDGDVDGVSEYLFKAKSIKGFVNTTEGSSGYSALHHAAFGGLLKVAEVIVQAGGNVLATDKFGKTPAHLAIQKGHVELALFLLGQRSPLDYPKTAKLTLLQTAALQGHDEVIRFLVVRGVGVDEPTPLGETPLHLSVTSGRHSSISALLSLGAFVSAATLGLKQTPLHYACMAGDKEATLLLLGAGADPHLPNNATEGGPLGRGRTALEVAKDSGYRPLFNVLLDADMQRREEEEEAAAAREEAAQRTHETLQQKLVELQNTNSALGKELKSRRAEDKLLEKDHELAVQRERKNIMARRASMKRVSLSSGKLPLNGGGSSNSLTSGGK